MNLEELIASTNKVKNRSQSKVFQKKFGSIMAFNKKVSVTGNGTNAVIAVSMMIGGVTDMIKSGGKRRPVPFHRAVLALKVGEEGYKEYTASELVQVIRSKTKEFDGLPDPDVLADALDHPTKYFEDSTLFAKSSGKGYAVVKNQIPKDSEVQVWCSCSDYYWTFEYYNIHAKGGGVNYYPAASAAYPKIYNHQSAKGRSSKRPMRNPGSHPGMCKHLMLLTAMLMKDDLIKNTRNGLSKFFEVNFKEFISDKMKTHRLNQHSFDQVMKGYKEGQRELSKQRSSLNYIYGNKVERKYDAERGIHRGSNKVNNGTSTFDPFSGKRTFKNAVGRKGRRK